MTETNVPKPADVEIPQRPGGPENPGIAPTDAELAEARGRRNRKIYIGVFSFVILFALLLAFRPGRAAKSPSNVGAPPKLDASNPNLTPELIAAQQRGADQDKAQQILSDPHSLGQGKGYVPKVTPEFSDPLAAYATTANGNAPPGPPTVLIDPNPTPVPPPQDPKIPPVTARQPQIATAAPGMDRMGAMAAAMQKMLGTRSDMEGESFTGTTVTRKVAATKSEVGSRQEGDQAGVGSGDSAKKNLRVFERTGQMLYAVTDLLANSDSSPFMQATVVGGPYEGAKLQGSFRRLDEELEIDFHKISWRNVTYPIDSVAVNPDSPQIGLATSVNHHYIERFGGVFAAGFLSGYGQAKETEGNSISVNTNTGSTQSSTPQRSTSDLAVIGLGKAAQDSSSLFMELAHRPITVKVAAGTPVGILFKADWVDDPGKDLPNATTVAGEASTLAQQIGNAKSLGGNPAGQTPGSGSSASMPAGTAYSIIPGSQIGANVSVPVP